VSDFIALETFTTSGFGQDRSVILPMNSTSLKQLYRGSIRQFFHPSEGVRMLRFTDFY
jgi:hypothetical protein